MRRSKFRRPQPTLIFNGARVLIAASSLNSAAELTHTLPASIHSCCIGKNIRSGVYYYRQLHPDILIDLSDLDNLKLEEYDSLCGDQRKYISTKDMARIRQRAKAKRMLKSESIQ